MVSKARRTAFEKNEDPNGLSVEERLSIVYDADLANWAHNKAMQNQIEQEMNHPNSIN